jgi:hypothetical protein
MVELTGLFLRQYLMIFDAGSRVVLTSFAYRLLAAGKSEGVDSQSAADCAAKLDWDLILREGAEIS